jgi:hypothetical protein
MMRTSGSDNAARIELSVPKGKLSSDSLAGLLARLRKEGFDVGDSRSTSTEDFLRVSTDVPDIWDDAAGLKGARAAHLVLAAFSVDHEERFDFRLEGTRKWRSRPKAKTQ